ncbi:hypothetical protein P0G38_09300 [Enterococcus casseliflavus]|uniref:hypothetical protein n=1 Tax=Enterococcus casseliflavus TaxID=37734 RepID=UPI0023DC08D0|nr:hypothetical protein [Enterococcus casseliflavus]WEL45970.1 hypothetical protein P0G38_09300 [Enterococcus casseliflavus]
MVPKFRGKRKDNGEWVVGVPIPNSFCNVVHMIPILLTDKVAYPPERLHEYLIEIVPETLGQSTGLKGYMSDSHEDDEEKDVYRGDIIDIFWEEWPMGYYQENHMIGVVDKDETGTAWIIKDAKYDFDTPKPIPSEIDGISVSMSLPDAEDLEEIFLHNFNLTSSDITILGNICENPELLEQANEN